MNFQRILRSVVGLILFTASALHAQETDSRLHSDGKGWRVDQAKITDPKRPRVLLIGDSILNGYLTNVAAQLDGKVYVDGWVNRYAQSEHLNKLLAEVLAHGPYDVVHFNMGLHGWQKGRIKGGITHGESDQWGYKPQNRATPTEVYDIHATILHLLGIDHTKLTFRHNGVDRRLTDVHGEIIRPILA